MTIEQLVSVTHAQPFRPFRVHLADGRALDIQHPDFIARSPAGRTVVIYKADETLEIVDLLLVSSIEVLNGQAQSPKSP